MFGTRRSARSEVKRENSGKEVRKFLLHQAFVCYYFSLFFFSLGVVHELMGWKNNDNPISKQTPLRSVPAARSEREWDFHLHFFFTFCLHLFAFHRIASLRKRILQQKDEKLWLMSGFLLSLRVWNDDFFFHVCQEDVGRRYGVRWKGSVGRFMCFAFRTHDKSHLRWWRKLRTKRLFVSICNRNKIYVR